MYRYICTMKDDIQITIIICRVNKELVHKQCTEVTKKVKMKSFQLMQQTVSAQPSL